MKIILDLPRHTLGLSVCIVYQAPGGALEMSSCQVTGSNNIVDGGVLSMIKAKPQQVEAADEDD